MNREQLRSRVENLSAELEAAKRMLDLADGDTVMLTSKMIHGAGNGGVGFSAAQLAVLGITWPPQKGWLKSLVGSRLPRSQWDKFVASKKNQ